MVNDPFHHCDGETIRVHLCEHILSYDICSMLFHLAVWKFNLTDHSVQDRVVTMCSNDPSICSCCSLLHRSSGQSITKVHLDFGIQ